VRKYDLELHLQIKHGFSDLDIQNLSAQGDRAGMEFETPWFGNRAGFEAERALDAPFDLSMSIEEDIEEAAARGGQFWLGGAWDEHPDAGDDWLRDEMEMQQLIGRDDQEDMFDHHELIDPTLR